jgi:hypothetical protein
MCGVRGLRRSITIATTPVVAARAGAGVADAIVTCSGQVTYPAPNCESRLCVQMVDLIDRTRPILKTAVLAARLLTVSPQENQLGRRAI